MIFLMAALDFSFLKKFKSLDSLKQSAPSIGNTAELKKQISELELQLELYNLIIERYRKFIEDGESKSVSELRLLVRPMDSSIIEMKISIEDSFNPYSYDSNFLLATQRAMDTIFAWKRVKMPLSFWMGFDDMIRLRAADDIDRAIILCSLFRALGSQSARVLLGKDKTAWVSFLFGQKQYVVDIGQKTMSTYPLDEDGIKQFMYNIQYSFNEKDYEDYSKE
ncbi:hypothetical protein COU37_05450 [Candidatus Micrarchaeota archaeon CG10_big_fil_rev_8_21_14_0_10_45_29]|nr:MAG: hypothetical protein COU37_05450 [Candidatus Micrarchaeota archaeon CG10_big_fil_rev_8_21_14_0_10_45_29]